MAWATRFTLDDLQRIGRGTASETCGMRFTAFGDDWLEATMPLDERTRDVSGALHPGALAILAESIGSVAASLTINTTRNMCVGQIIHVSHPIVITSGPLFARTSLVAAAEDSQVWNIEIKDPTGEIVCVVRLTMAILQKSHHPDG